ncbi:hypothetical protein J3E69DRAFT_287151 [Trichoderma sp. SZMC 28015]
MKLSAANRAARLVHVATCTYTLIIPLPDPAPDAIPPQEHTNWAPFRRMSSFDNITTWAPFLALHYLRVEQQTSSCHYPKCQYYANIMPGYPMSGRHIRAHHACSLLERIRGPREIIVLIYQPHYAVKLNCWVIAGSGSDGRKWQRIMQLFGDVLDTFYCTASRGRKKNSSWLLSMTASFEVDGPFIGRCLHNEAPMQEELRRIGQLDYTCKLATSYGTCGSTSIAFQVTGNHGHKNCIQH